MEWVERMNGAIEYIENHLTEKIDFEEVAQIAGCSVYQFQRMFSFILGMSLSEYIRCRRLTLAAFELQNSRTKIIDLALKYGYESQDAFARAFQKVHGVVPSLVRKKGVTLKAYPRISFHISIKGAEEMKYTIVEKEAFEVFGIEEIFSTIGDPNYKSVPDFWKECHENGMYERLFDAAGTHRRDPSYQGICAVNAVLNYRKTDNNTFPYMLCAFLTDQGQPEGFTRVKIPALTWAIFTSEEGHPGYLFQRVYSEWLPTADYTKLDGPDFEIYGSTGNGNLFSEVWISVVKK